MEEQEQFKVSLEQLYKSKQKFLEEKNRKYGNSALNPMGIFTKHVKSEDSSTAGILVRIDDKLNRIKNGEELRLNDVLDLSGYLDLLMIKKGWFDFREFLE